MRPSLFKSLRLPLALILLGLLPIAASVYRVAMLAGTDPATVTNADDARFFAMPVPILLHVIFGSLFLVLGALQMSASLRQRARSFHRRSGWVALLAGLTFALSGVWMVFTYPSHSLAALSIDIARILFGTFIAGAILAGIRAALRKDTAAHRAWMIRAYAVSASAGLQSYLIGLSFAINGSFDAKFADAMMWLGWIIGFIAAEWIVARPNRRRARKPSHPQGA